MKTFRKFLGEKLIENEPRLTLGIVVPTLGERLEYLNRLFVSLQDLQIEKELVIVCPKSKIDAISAVNKSRLDLRYVQDPGSGLANAINKGFESLTTKYWNWIGDDDLLCPAGVQRIICNLESSPMNTFGWGDCSYVDQFMNIIGVNKVGVIATKVIYFGPNLISQPSCVFRVNLTRALGGLNSSLKYSFDQDLIMKFLEIGIADHVNVVSSMHGWHSESLTLSNRRFSAKESFFVRLQFASQKSFLWKFLVILMYPLTQISLTISDMALRLISFYKKNRNPQ